MDGQPVSRPSIDKSASFIAYDGRDLSANQNIADLNEDVTHPFIRRPGRLMPNGDYEVQVSIDGHYYISGAVNGFPVRFMVDSGAASSSIDLQIAKNAGMRVGMATPINTADGQIIAGVTEGNLITIPNGNIANARIMVLEGTRSVLLGADVLNALDISYSKGMMTIKAIKKEGGH
jgi:aspartyl protease family protein